MDFLVSALSSLSIVTSRIDKPAAFQPLLSVRAELISLVVDVIITGDYGITKLLRREHFRDTRLLARCRFEGRRADARLARESAFNS